MVGLLKILLQLSPDRASQTAFQLTLDFRGTQRATSSPATAGDEFNATPSDAWSSGYGVDLFLVPYNHVLSYRLVKPAHMLAEPEVVHISQPPSIMSGLLLRSGVQA